MTEPYLPSVCPFCHMNKNAPTEAEMMVQVTLYKDAMLTIDGRAKKEAVPYVLRQIADAIENGTTLLDMPMN